MSIAAISDRTESRRWAALGVIIAAQFMVILDIAIVNVALPAIKADLHFSQGSLQWVVTAYAIVFGGVLLLGGRLADLFGRRRLFLVGVGVFVASSLLSGLAWSEGSLIAFRALQGLGGALLAPAALSILTTTFTEGRERNIALGVYGAASGSGGAVGVLLGGVLTSYLDWSWIFFINIPFGLAVIALTPWLLRESRAGLGSRHLDLAGTATVTGGLMLLVYAMTRATQVGWGTAGTITLLAVSVLLLAAFVAIELRSAAPLVPLRILRLRTLTAANATMILIAGVGFSQFFLLTLYMQEVLRYSAVETGVAFAAIALTVVVFSNVAQKLTTRVGPRRVLVAGLLVSAAAVALYSRLPVDGHYFWDMFPAFVLGGIGLSLGFVSATIAGLTGVHPSEAGVASGLINTSRQVGGAVGLAAVSTIAATGTSAYVRSHDGATALSPDALAHGFQIAFYVLVGLALAGAAVAAAFVQSRPGAPEVEPARDEVVEVVDEAA